MSFFSIHEESLLRFIAFSPTVGFANRVIVGGALNPNLHERT